MDTQRVIIGSGFQNPLSTPERIDCSYCGLQEDIGSQSPLLRLERLEYHRRGSCVRNDLGLDPEWSKKWQVNNYGEKRI